jgi:hypothetical protein
VPVLATSEFLGSLFVVLVATPFILLWAAAVVDVIRLHLTGWTIVGWLLVILVLPILGPIIYFALRKPTAEDVEHAEQGYLAAQDLERARAARPVGGVGMGP